MQAIDKKLTKRANDLYQMIYWCDRSRAYTWGIGGSARVEELRLELAGIISIAKSRGGVVPAEVEEACKS